jgi:hypothetical protein
MPWTIYCESVSSVLRSVLRLVSVLKEIHDLKKKKVISICKGMNVFVPKTLMLKPPQLCWN